MSSSATTISGALAAALEEILDIAITDAQNFPEFFVAVVTSVIVPGVVVLLLVIVVVKVCSKIYRYFFPPSAKELYREALTIYNQQSNFKRTEQLLWQAVTTEPDWKPALLSLIALYVYRLEEPHKALKILNGFETCSRDPEFEALRLDAQAMLQSNNHMVQKLMGEDEYLSLRAAAVSKFK